MRERAAHINVLSLLQDLIDMWHGILIDQAFTDRAFPDTFDHFAKEKTVPLGWLLHGIVVVDTEFESAIIKIQQAMRSDKVYYSHLYNDRELIVVFKEEVFRVGSHQSTWGPIRNFGHSGGVPEEQLDFWPNRFQDERHYFKKESFLRERGRTCRAATSLERFLKKR